MEIIKPAIIWLIQWLKKSGITDPSKLRKAHADLVAVRDVVDEAINVLGKLLQEVG